MTATARSSAQPRTSRSRRVLAGFPVLTAVPRAARRAVDRQGQAVRHGRLNLGGISRRPPTGDAPCTSTATSAPSRRAAVTTILKTIRAMESRGAVEAKALAVAEELERIRLGEAAGVVGARLWGDLGVYRLPPASTCR